MGPEKPWPTIDSALMECLKEWANQNAPSAKDGTTPQDAFRALARWEGITLVIGKMDAVFKNQRRRTADGTASAGSPGSDRPGA